MSMVASRQVDHRKNQKDRTRDAIVAGAMTLLRSGSTPTVLSAAEEAKVSRATAYRYFPTQESLMNEVMSITPTLVPVEEGIQKLSGSNPAERLATVLNLLNRTMLENEAVGRAAMRLYLDLWFESKKKTPSVPPTVRAGRRRGYIEAALSPVIEELPPEKRRLLINALSLTLGIDNIVILKDTCGLDNEEALAVLQWSARVLLEAGLREAEAGAQKGKPRTRRTKAAAD